MRTKVWLAILLLAALGFVAQADITATIEDEADTWINSMTETHGAAPADGNDFMSISGPEGGQAYMMGYLRFNLSGLHVDAISNATLTLIYYPRNAAAGVNYSMGPMIDGVVHTRFALQGLDNVAGNTPQDWDEATLNQSNTGLEVDWPANTGQLTPGRFTDLDDNVPGITEDLIWNEPFKTNNQYWVAGCSKAIISGAPLIAFLNSRVDDNGLVTFIISGDRGYGLGTRENNTVPYAGATFATYHPILTLTYTLGGASNPQPADGASANRNTLTQLSWTLSPPEIGKCDVYLGTEPNIVNMTKLSFTPAVTSVNINSFPGYSVPLAAGTYYWRVDCYKGNPLPAEPNLLGEYWSFNATDFPVFTQQTTPTKLQKFEKKGETAEFSVIVDSTTDVTYSWYRSADNANNTEPDTEVGVGTNSPTLTLPNVTAVDAGYYYCKAVNSYGEARSNPARLSIKQLYARWALDGNADDSSDNALDGTLFGAPVFETGIEDPNQAMVFDGTDDYIDMPDGFSDFTPGVTISVWAKPTTAANNARFIDFGNGASSDNIYLNRNGTANDLSFNVYVGATSAGRVTSVNAIVLNEWQMFVATMDESGSVKLYKNGLEVQTGTMASQPSLVTRTSNFVGKSNWTADALYAGLMDDIQIFNYAKSADDVAGMYAHIAGNFCRYTPTYDLTGDCKTTMADFAMFAAQWLACGMYPICP